MFVFRHRFVPLLAAYRSRWQHGTRFFNGRLDIRRWTGVRCDWAIRRYRCKTMCKSVYQKLSLIFNSSPRSPARARSHISAGFHHMTVWVLTGERSEHSGIPLSLDPRRSTTVSISSISKSCWTLTRRSPKSSQRTTCLPIGTSCLSVGPTISSSTRSSTMRSHVVPLLEMPPFV